MWPFKLGKLPAVLTENTNKIQAFDLIEAKVKSAFLPHSASVQHFSEFPSPFIAKIKVEGSHSLHPKCCTVSRHSRSSGIMNLFGTPR